MHLHRGYFSVPLDTSDELLQKSFRLYATRWTEIMDRKGWRLVSDYKFAPIPIHPDKTRKHINILGYFEPRFGEKEWIFEDLPAEVAQKVLDKYGTKARIL